MKFSSPHISFAALVDFVEGRTSPEQGAEARAHAAVCARCDGEMSRLEHVVGLMRTDEAEDAPRDLVAHAVGLFRSKAATATPKGFRKILAALDFDSMELKPAYGVRSGQVAARQLLFSAGGNDLDIRVAPSGEAWVVTGQVLGDCDGGGEANLRGDNADAHVELNEQCEFTLPPVPGGSYTLNLKFAGIEIEVPKLELGA